MIVEREKEIKGRAKRFYLALERVDKNTLREWLDEAGLKYRAVGQYKGRVYADVYGKEASDAFLLAGAGINSIWMVAAIGTIRPV